MAPDEPRDRKDLATQVSKRFFLPLVLRELLPGLEASRATLSPPYSDLAEVFARNLTSVISTLGIPVTLASAAAEGSHWQRIHMAERIRALIISAEGEEDETAVEVRRSENAHKIALEKMKEFSGSDEGRDQMAADSCRFLLTSLDSEDMVSAAGELLLQGEVLIWSALESLARDLFEAILNADPKRILPILRDPTAKHRLPSRFTVEELASFGFDVSTSFGSVLSSYQDFSDIRTIRALLQSALNSDATVEAALADRRLWMLCQRRHLIVHRRGVVDLRYIEATGDQAPQGSRLSVVPSDLEADFQAVGLAGTALLVSAQTHAG